MRILIMVDENGNEVINMIGNDLVIDKTIQNFREYNVKLNTIATEELINKYRAYVANR